MGRGGDGRSLWTDKFQPFGPVLPATDAMEFQLSSIIRAKRDSELIQKRFVPVCGIAAIHGNNGSCKPKLSQQGAVSVIAVESGVSQESIITQSRMSGEKIPEDREQRSGISNFFVYVRAVCALFNGDFRMGLFEIVIEKSNAAHDPQTIGQDPCLLCVTKVAVDILLFHR